MNRCYNVVRYMDTSAAAYRLVSAACNLPFMDLKYRIAGMFGREKVWRIWRISSDSAN